FLIFLRSIFEKRLLRFGVNLVVVIVVDCSSSVTLTSRVVVEQSLLHNANVACIQAAKNI
ncbi:unnamed protein product, partial [Rotaria sp. Silwood2]